MKSSTHVGTSATESELRASAGAPRGPAGASAVEPDGSLEPVRLLAGGNAFEQQLLGSARVDHMPVTSRERLARALNVPPAAPGAAPPSRLLQRWSPLGRYGSIVGVGAAALVAAWAVRKAPAPVEPSRQPVGIAARSTSAEGRGGVLDSRSTEPESSPPVIASEALGVIAPSPPSAPPSDSPAKPRAPVRAAPAAPRTARAGLREELRALEAVQGSLRAGRFREARAGLDDHARRFPDGELRLEAELLALDVSLARGERRYTRERARALLARPDAARYRGRLEALWLAAGGEPDAAPVGSDSRRIPHSKVEVTE